MKRYEYNINNMEELIKNYFKGQKQKEFCIGNHGNYKCGIITNDKEKVGKQLKKTYKNYKLVSTLTDFYYRRYNMNDKNIKNKTKT